MFLASTAYGYEERRRLLSEAIESLDCTPILSDHRAFTVTPGLHSHDVCLAQVAVADIVVLVLQERYGQEYLGDRPEYNGISITRAEYREATRLGKTVLALSEQRIPEQRQVWKKNSTDPRLTIAPEVFEFYFEVSSSHEDNFISWFRDSFECRDLLRNRLSTLVNRSLAQIGTALRRERFAMPLAGPVPGGVDVLSEWSIECQDLNYVTKTWTISVHNASDSKLDLLNPLIYPVPYQQAQLSRSRAQVIRDRHKFSETRNISAEIRPYGAPIHQHALVIQPRSPISLEPTEILRVQTQFKHSGYFTRIGSDLWVHTGRVFHMDYPELRGRNVIQRVSKEYKLRDESLTVNGRKLVVKTSPPVDWARTTQKFMVLGFGRYYDAEGGLSINIVLSA